MALSTPVARSEASEHRAVNPESSIDSLRELADRDEIRFFLATFTTLTGKPCAKLMPAHAAGLLQTDGAGFAGFAAGGMGQQPSDPDVVVFPDLSSYAPIPFIKPGLAMIHCDPYVNGLPYPFAPRIILKRAVEYAATKGYALQVGAEVEYFLVRRASDGTLKVADERDDSVQPCYDARGVTRMYDHLSAVGEAMHDLGWGPYASDHEDANGQFEQNFLHADPLTTADRVMTLRYVIQMLAEQRNMTATFMPKPFTDRTGNGMHLHLSLWRESEALFPNRGDDVRGFGLSPEAYAFIGGLLSHASGLQALIAPTVNSYKRTGARTTRSGATWAPATNVPTFGGNDRTHLIRVPAANRVELRGPDGSANPYLAISGALLAGLDGIDRNLDPDTAATEALPMTLIEAITAFEHDSVVRNTLDCDDPETSVSKYYADMKRDEFYAWHNTVSPWEIEQYLT